LKYFTSIIFIILFVFSNNVFATEKCGTMQALDLLVEANADVLNQLEKIENFTKNNTITKKKERELITIPIIFHVVYSTPSENISEEKILSQLDVLNEDFRKLNPNFYETLDVFKDRAADFEIEFCLAQTDPDGLPTSGINRAFTDSATFSISNNMKFTALSGADAWPVNDYLNFWVCDLEPGLLGYAQFPGLDEATDGVVVDYIQVGRGFTNGITGRTATHEVGHWLNLRHIWGDGDCTQDDLVEDTPPAESAHSGCSLSANSCSAGESEPDMVQNYMDYSDDGCLTLFTEGQKQRARVLFESGGSKFALATSTKCAAPVLANLDARLIEVIEPQENQNYCTTSVAPIIKFRNYGNNELTTVKAEVYVDGELAATSLWTGNLLTGDYGDFKLDAFDLTAGRHEIKLLLAGVNSQIDEKPEDNELTLNVQVLGKEIPLEQGFETNVFPPDFYNLIDLDEDNKGFQINNNVAKSGNSCLYINCFEYDTPGSIDDFVLPIINLKNFKNTKLEFYNAYARYDATDSDTLQILVSKDCGATFTSVMKRQGALLASEGNTTSAFVPSASDKWKLRTVNLSEFDGAENLIVKFRCINSHEQNLYIDDIAIIGDEIVGINENTANFDAIVYPNPAKNRVQLTIDNLKIGTFRLISIEGKVLEEQKIIPNQKQYDINLEKYNNGTYFVSLNNNSNSKTIKLFILK